jgi:hypothetical protein
MHREPTQVVLAPLTFTGMQPGTRSEAEARQLLYDRLCALDSPGWTGEGQNETIARAVDFLATEVLHLSSYDTIMRL